MSAKYNMVKNFYDKGLWSIARVRAAVVKEWITPAEFKQITGQDYDG